ncbi:MAG TPA: ABC transporter permease [Mycobacteriales bacterium]|nr:ABC transporter permease [Mycobacteriales bacterium]
MTEVESPPRQQAATGAPAPGPRVGLVAGIATVTAGQLGRVRVARGPLLFVATVQSLGLVLLLRGVVHHHDTATAASIVAGSTVLVVAFVSLNLLAQRFGALRAAAALDYYAALPVPPAAVVLGTAAAYGSFAVPGSVLTAVIGVAIYGLPAAQLWVAVPAVLVAAAALAGVGALVGLALPRPELATVAGQLGMTAVLFLGIIAPTHLPEAVRAIRAVVPGTLAVDALASALRTHPDWTGIVVRLIATAGYGGIALAIAGRVFRRAVDR